MKYRVTKTYGHERGLSCAFRQWRAESHCRFIHGYALAFKLVFGSDSLDDKGWVIDFGSLGPVKEMLGQNFDHVLAVAADDPSLPELLHLSKLGVVDVMVHPDGVGCEKFAAMVFGTVTDWLATLDLPNRPKLLAVECREHSGNAASVHRGFN